MNPKTISIILSVLLLACLIFSISQAVRIGQMQTSLTDLETRLAAADDEGNRLRGEVEQLEKHAEEQTAQSEAFSASLQAPLASLEALEEHAASILKTFFGIEQTEDKQDGPAEEDTAAVLESGIAKTESLLTSLGAAFDEKVKALSGESLEKSRVIEKLSSDLSVSTILNDAQASEIAAVNAEKASLEGQVKNLQNSVDSLTAEVSEKDRNIAALNREKEEMVAQLLTMQTVLSEWLDPAETD